MNTTLTAEALQELHAFTMDTYRLRLAKLAETHGTEFAPEVSEALARMIDMCAAERVLDEADYTEMPGWNHPATIEIRKRLLAAEEMIAALSTVPMRLRAAMAADGGAELWQLAMLDHMEAATNEATDGLALTAVSDLIATTRVRQIDEIVEELHQRAFRVAVEQQDGAGLAASKALVEAADALDVVRAATFRAVDHHRIEVSPDVHMMI